MNMNKSDLSFYISEDVKRRPKKVGIIDLILHNEAWYIAQYVKHLRYVEYHKGKNGLHKLLYLYHWYKYKHLGFKLKMTIYPYTVGPGLRIYHSGDFLHIGENCSVGRNFTTSCGVVLGAMNAPITIGDNCTLNIGVKVIKPVTIGDNVIVGVNSVVTKDIPSNAVAVGIPAKVIKLRNG